MASPGGASYGSLMVPVDLGSGGGGSSYWSMQGGAGGGALQLVVGGTLTVNGQLAANGLTGGPVGRGVGVAVVREAVCICGWGL